MRHGSPPPELVRRGGDPRQSLLGDWHWRTAASGRLLVRSTPHERRLAVTVLEPARDRLVYNAVALPPDRAATLIAGRWDMIGPDRIEPAGVYELSVVGPEPPLMISVAARDGGRVLVGPASEAWWAIACARALGRLRRLASDAEALLAVENGLLDAVEAGLRPGGPDGRGVIRAMQRALGCPDAQLVPEDAPAWCATAALQQSLLTWVAVHQRSALGAPVESHLRSGERQFIANRSAYLELEAMADEPRLAVGYVYVPEPRRVVEEDLVVGAKEAVALEAAFVIVGFLSTPGQGAAKRELRAEWLGVLAFVEGRMADLCSWFVPLAEELARSGATWLADCRVEVADALRRLTPA